MKKYLIVALIFLGNMAIAQKTDTTLRKNTVKLDITSRWLYRNAYVLSYERTTKPNQSFAVSAGLHELPTFISFGDLIIVDRQTQSSGYKFGGEYRFYLKKENKYNAPHGVYIGPYFSYLAFSNTRDLRVNNNGTDEFAELTTSINVLNTGVQLGYQFVINNRWTVDMVFIGPSLSNYNAKLKLDGNYTFDPDDIQNEIIQRMIDRFPALQDLISGETVSQDGKVNTWSFGYRYQFLVGYHFGRK